MVSFLNCYISDIRNNNSLLLLLLLIGEAGSGEGGESPAEGSGSNAASGDDTCEEGSEDGSGTLFLLTPFNWSGLISS